MSDSAIRELYQSMIIDHGRSPRNFKVLEGANHQQEGYNPLCGDQLTVYLIEEAGVIKEASFQGCGCAISMASASLMTETVKGKTVEEAREIFEGFHQCLLESGEAGELPSKLKVLLGVKAYPSRVKCATLAWHALVGAVGDDNAMMVSTE